MKIVSLFLSLAVMASFAMAQFPEPAKELSKFNVAIGNWTGSGTSNMSPEGPSVDWTSDMTYTKIVDGYAIQEDVRVDIAGLGVLAMRSVYAWDAHANRFVYFSMSNMGYGGHGITYWAGENTLVGSHTRTEQEHVVTDAFATAFKKDSVELRIDRSIAGGDFFRYVDGKYERGGDGFDAAESEDVVALVPAPKQMSDLDGHTGDWTVKGKFSPLPGLPLMPISGKNKVRSILGAHAHFTKIQGDDVPPKAYQGHAYLAWDPAANAYASFSVDNYGGMGFETAHRQGDNKMIHLASMVLWGAPQAGRTTVEWDPDTRKTTLKSHRLGGTNEPDVSFEATLEPDEAAEN